MIQRKKNNNSIYFRFVLVLAIIAGVSYAVFGLSKHCLNVTSTNNVEIPTIITTLTPEVPKEFAQKKIFGKSAKGKDIEGYVIGEGKKTIFIFGGIHGNEIGTVPLLERLLIELKSNNDLLSKDIRLVLLPVANPDGYYDRMDKLNANGVNLNLNFDTTEWQHYGPDEGQWAGDKPFSEPESNVIKSIVEEYKPKMMLSFHSQGSYSIPEENKASYDLAYWYAQKTGYYYNDTMFDYFGTATRWFTEHYENVGAITIELSSHVLNDWDMNKKALLELVGDKAQFDFFK